MSHIKLMNLDGYDRENIKNKYKTLTAVGGFYILFYCHIFYIVSSTCSFLF